MKTLKEIRLEAIERCKENNCSYVCISNNKSKGFYITDDVEDDTVYFVNKNGSLDKYHKSNYANNYHKTTDKSNNKRSKTINKKDLYDKLIDNNLD